MYCSRRDGQRALQREQGCDYAAVATGPEGQGVSMFYEYGVLGG